MNNLKKARTEIGLTQKQVAERVGIAERVYQRYETAQRVPTIDVALQISKTLKTNVEYLFGTSNNQA